MLLGAQVVDVGVHFQCLVGCTSESTLAHFLQGVLGFVCRAIKLVFSLCVHQQYVGVAHIGEVDTRIARRRVALCVALVPEFRPLQTVVDVTVLYGCHTVVSVRPVAHGVAAYILFVEGEAIESVQSAASTHSTPRMVGVACAGEVGLRAVDVADVAVHVLYEWNLEDDIVVASHGVVALVVEHLHEIAGQGMGALLDD